MRKKILLFLICIISFLGFSQNKRFIDSVSTEIIKETSDSLKSNIYYNSGRIMLQKLGDIKVSRAYIDSSMHYAKISKYKRLEAQSHFLYGLLDRLEGNYDEALKHLETNITYFKNDSINKSYAMFQKGIIYKQLGDLDKSLSTYLEILNIFETKKDSFAVASTLNSIANIYGDMKNYKEAITNYEDARQIFIKKNIKRDVCNTEKNIALMHYYSGDYDNSIKFAENALKISREISYKQLEGTCLNILGNLYIESDFKKGLAYYLKAKKILDGTSFKIRKLGVNKSIGIAYFKAKNYSKSKEYLLEAFEFAEEKKILSEIQTITKILSEIAAKESNYQLAYNYRMKHIKAKDSILNTENSKNINLLQKQFETEKKDKEIVEQKLVLSDQQRSIQNSKSKTRLMTILIISLLLASILLWFVFQQRQKRIQQQLVTLQKEQEVSTLESLIEGEEKERLRIAKELHDGVNGDLSAIKYKLSSLLKMNNEVIKEAVSMIDNSCKQVRAISHNLVPPSLKDFNLVEAIQNYCETMGETHTPTILFQHLGNALELNKKIEVNIFRIVQELVTNAIKHANATKINVQTSYQEDTIQLTIEDDGIGLDLSTTKNNGIGLQNVQSRIDYLKAELDVVSNNQGTSYTIDINTSKLDEH